MRFLPFDCEYSYLIWTLKFIYSEKATKFCEIFTLLLTGKHGTNKRWRLRKLLRPSQNIWTLLDEFGFTFVEYLLMVSPVFWHILYYCCIICWTFSIYLPFTAESHNEFSIIKFSEFCRFSYLQIDSIIQTYQSKQR